MDEYRFIKYWEWRTITDYDNIRKIAHDENIVNNIIIWINSNPSYELYLIYKDEEVIGFWWYKTKDTDGLEHNFILQNFYVKKSLQWQWIMGKLYEFLENKIKESWHKKVRIESSVTETNEHSKRFFEKHWFKEFGFAKDRIYDKINDSYVWTKYFEKIIKL